MDVLDQKLTQKKKLFSLNINIIFSFKSNPNYTQESKTTFRIQVRHINIHDVQLSDGPRCPFISFFLTIIIRQKYK